MRQGAATTPDGIAIQYTIHGDDRPNVPRLVLVHSLGMNGSVWEWVIERLVPHTTVLTLDCRGHGTSTRAPGPYRLETFARDLADVLDHASWDRCYLAGGSMGGNVSLQFAILYPSRVSGLGLIDTTAWYGVDAHQRWEQRASEAEEKGLGPLIDFQESRWFTDGFRAARSAGVERCRSVFLANDPACFAATCRMLGSFDLRAGLRGLRMPTAVVVGEEDYATPPAMARELQGAIPGATLQVIPGARHLTFVERPDVVATALTELLSRVV
jgi:3-oxoadipate enol-lactonase